MYYKEYRGGYHYWYFITNDSEKRIYRYLWQEAKWQRLPRRGIIDAACTRCNLPKGIPPCSAEISMKQKIIGAF